MAGMKVSDKYWREWSNPRLVVAVLNNRDLNQVTWEMREVSGAPQFEESQHLPDVPYARIAERIGLEGVRVETPEQVVGAWEPAPAASWPFVIDFRTDPTVPPIPPHASLDQNEAAASAILRGDSDRGSMIKQGFKAKVQEMLPGGSATAATRPAWSRGPTSDHAGRTTSETSDPRHGWRGVSPVTRQRTSTPV
ncbi:thiamine pyrophosphate-dependent enzyme [Streptomyces sp. NPDC058595]|uniref:thiamine pyrophosphate-dependent enzyme n=1 Tax=Streptomyces sp. NPDC058595 TaxID=3346550 RepID=UPI003649B804